MVFCNKVWLLQGLKTGEQRLKWFEHQCGETNHIRIDFLLKTLMLTRYLYIIFFPRIPPCCLRRISRVAVALLRGILKIRQLAERMVVELVQT